MLRENRKQTSFKTVLLLSLQNSLSHSFKYLNYSWRSYVTYFHLFFCLFLHMRHKLWAKLLNGVSYQTQILVSSSEQSREGRKYLPAGLFIPSVDVIYPSTPTLAAQGHQANSTQWCSACTLPMDLPTPNHPARVGLSPASHPALCTLKAGSSVLLASFY